MRIHTDTRTPTTAAVVFSVAWLVVVLGQLQPPAPIIPLNNFNYNQPCVVGSQCNNNAGLYCIPTGGQSGQLRCGCPTNNTVFDEYQGRCVGRVGHPCIHQGNHTFCPEKAHCGHTDPHRPDLYFHDLRCFCDANYFSTKDGGKCVLAAKFAEPCSASSKKCDEVVGLKCIGGKCECALGHEDQFYDPLRDKCISRLGKKCRGYFSCIDNGRCDGGHPVQRARAIPTSLNEGGKGSQSKGSSVSDGGKGSSSVLGTAGGEYGKCVCEYGFTPTQDGKCLGGYRQTCSDSQICNSEDGLDCLDGSCNCQSPLHMQYDHAERRCVGLVGAKCSNIPGKTSCVPHAECEAGGCRCVDKFSKTPFRKCMLDFGEPCDNGECNSYNGLTCKSSGGKKKVCACVDESIAYDGDAKGCVSKGGSPCGKISQAGDYGKEFFYVSCERGSRCEQVPGGDSTTALCTPPGMK